MRMHTVCADAHRLCGCTPSVRMHTVCADTHRLCGCTPGVSMHTVCAHAHRLCACTPSVRMHTVCAHAHRLCGCTPSAIICPWVDFSFLSRCPQVVWCHRGKIELFSAALAQDRMAKCDHTGKNPLKTSAMAGN